MPRSIEDAIRIRQRQIEELRTQLATLEAAAKIMDDEPEIRLPMAVSPGVPAEPRGIPNISANPMATQPPPREQEREAKRWP